MNTTKDLITKAKNELENNTNIAGLVGNRMHFPMLIQMNGENSKNAYSIFTKAFKRMWPQTFENIIFYQNSPSDNNSFINLKTDSVVSKKELQSQLDEIRATRGVFESLLKWCVYNIIDTTCLNSVEEFIKIYGSLDLLKEISIDTVSSMLIVILDESSSKRELSKSIREYLVDKKDYDGTIVVANKTITNELYEINELLEIVSGVIVLSNNDAISHDDDENYNERYNCLFGNNRLTIAHSLLKRKNEKIAIQILDRLIENAETICLKKSLVPDMENWRKILHIERGIIDEFESAMNTLDLNLNYRDLTYFPYKEIPTFKNEINEITFAEFSAKIFDNSFDEYIQSVCLEKIYNSKTLKEALSEYETALKCRITAKDCTSLNEDTIEKLIGFIDLKKPVFSMKIGEYYANLIKYYIRERLINPFLKSLLSRLSNSSKPTIDLFYSFKNDFQTLIPLDGYSDLGYMYSLLAENYINTPVGEEKLKLVLSPENTYSDFISTLNNMFIDILNSNTETFSLPFIEEWKKRLDLDGETVFKKIQTTFNEDLNKKVFLFGNNLNTRRLEVYLFHTTDSQGNNPTDLYTLLKKAYQGISFTQFVNTGFDDCVEAYRFIDCSGTKIL